MTNTTYSLPTLAELQDILISLRNGLRTESLDDMDVRLVVGYPDSSNDGVWEIMTGDVSYDLWHGYCAEAVVTPDLNRVGCREVARDLLNDIYEQVAMDED